MAVRDLNTMSFSEPDTDILVPSFDVRALARRAAIPAALAVAVAGALVVAGGPLHAFAHALRRAIDADPRWVIGGAIFELLSFAGYVALFWMVGSRATKRLRLGESTQVTLGGAAATRLLPTAGVGGAAMTLWSLRRAGLGTRDATRTLLGFLIVLYSVFLTAIVTSGGLITLGIASGDGPLALSAIPALAAGLGIAGSLALGARRPRAPRRAARLNDAADVFGAAVRDAIGHVRSADPRLLGALAWWTFDAAVLWSMLHAFGAPPPFAVVVLAYFVGQVGNTIPIPGAVSGGIVGVLVAFQVPADLALVSVLAYRSIAIWLPAPIGLVALGSLRRTMTRWSLEDAADQVVVTQPQAAPAPVPVARAPRPCPEPAFLAA
jgi:putative heme transporter